MTTHEQARALATSHASLAKSYDAAAHDAETREDRWQAQLHARFHAGAAEAYADMARRIEEEVKYG